MTSDERIEIAARLRKAHGIMAFVEALGIDPDGDWAWTDVSKRVADLIDPTCEVVGDNPYTSDYEFKCKTCGEHFSAASTPRYCPGCGRRIDYGDR